VRKRQEEVTFVAHLDTALQNVTLEQRLTNCGAPPRGGGGAMVLGGGELFIFCDGHTYFEQHVDAR
jgi:hypothetical protein